jgi:hypothetical protein
MQSIVSRSILAALLLAFAAACASAGSTSNKWRLEFSGNAESDGVITVHLVELGNTFIVPVAVPKGTSENNVAKLVRDELKANLPHETYWVEVDDGEDVLVKGRDRVEPYSVLIAGNTVKGVRINVEKE